MRQGWGQQVSQMASISNILRDVRTFVRRNMNVPDLDVQSFHIGACICFGWRRLLPPAHLPHHEPHKVFEQTLATAARSFLLGRETRRREPRATHITTLQDGLISQFRGKMRLFLGNHAPVIARHGVYCLLVLATNFLVLLPCGVAGLIPSSALFKAMSLPCFATMHQ